MILSKLGLVKRSELEGYAEKLGKIEVSIDRYNKAVKRHNELAFKDDGKLLEIEVMEEVILNDIFKHIHDMNEGLKVVVDVDVAKKQVHDMELAKHKVKKDTEYRFRELEDRIEELENK